MKEAESALDFGRLAFLAFRLDDSDASNLCCFYEVEVIVFFLVI